MFINWVEKDEQENDPTELWKVISSFNDKHNTLQIIRQSASINDELFRIYDTYVKPSYNLPKECLFLTILKGLLPVLNREEIELWLKTYLRPAVDSAGFEMGFVHKSREFIRAITIDNFNSDDPDLQKYREGIARNVIEQILLINIGDESKILQIIDMGVTDEEKYTQVYHERIRYIRYLCAKFIDAYALKKTKDYLTIINKHFVNPDERLEVLTSLSSLVASQSSQVVHIVDTDLFESLIKCLHYDLSESVLSVSLALLTMLLPQICNKLSKYVSDLIIIFVRFSCWEEFDRHATNRQALAERHISENNITWKQKVLDPVNEPTSAKPRIAFDCMHYGTILYGLFPFNLSKFCQSPIKYLAKYPSNLIDIAYIFLVHKELNVNFGESEEALEPNIAEKVRDLYKSLLVHPKFIDFDQHSIEEEIQNPIKWLLDQRNGDLIGPEEIALSCVGLNPDIMINIHGSLISQENIKYTTKMDILGECNSGDSISGDFTGYTGPDTNMKQTSRQASRNSSISSPVYFSVKDGLTNKHMQKILQNFNRKMSIVPTNLVLANGADIPQESQEIRFNEVKFNEDKKNEDKKNDDVEIEDYDGQPGIENYGFGPSLPPSPLLRHSSWKSNDPLSDLFSSHETLFRPKNKTASSSTTYLHHHLQDPQNGEQGKRQLSHLLNDKLRNDLQIQRPISSPTTSVETATVHKGSIGAINHSMSPTSNSSTLNASNGSSYMKQSGSPLDFYHREVLLLKNELEFSSYMKHLNKFRYIKLKLNMNKMLREASLHFQAIENKNNLLQIKSLEENKISTNAILVNLRTKFKEHVDTSKNQQMELIGKLAVLKDEKEELNNKLQHVITESRMMCENLHTLQNETIPEINLENATLKNKITDLQNKQAEKNIQQENGVENPQRQETLKAPPDGEVCDHDKRIFELKGEILYLNEKITTLVREAESAQNSTETMSKTFETRLAASKLDMNEGLSSYTSQYEKKIQELSTMILKYESLLDEKNSKIFQLSSTKPISIPGTPATFGRNSSGAIRMAGRTSRASTSEFNGIYDTNERSNSSVDSINSPPPGPLQRNLYGSSNPNSQPRPISGPNAVPGLQPQPIVKGRGGYQKRSKKIM